MVVSLRLRQTACVLGGAFVAVALGACNKDSGGGRSGQSITPTEAQKANASEQTGAQVQEAVEAIEAVETSTTALGLAAGDSDNMAPTVTCTPSTTDDGKVTVVEKRDFEVVRENSNQRLTRSLTMTMDSTRTRVWTPPSGGAALGCNQANRANIDWSNAAAVNGLNMAVTIDETRSMDLDFALTRQNGAKLEWTLERAVEVDGTRNVDHSEHSVSGTTLSILRTVSSNVTRQESGTRRKGGGAAGAQTGVETEDYSMTHTNTTAEDAPMKIRTVIDTGTKKWTQKTIESGTFESTESSSSQKVTSVFENVVFAADSCLPTGGTIKGTVTNAEGQQLQSFVITFGTETDSKVSIAYDGGEAQDFPTASEYADGCSFANWSKAGG